jgi:dTDP-4-dehydrorhamnose reductase
VHFSTDYVFNGRKNLPYNEDDPCDPLNVYGLSKLEGERKLQSAGCDYLLIRTAWLFGKNGKNFVQAILNKASTNAVLEVVDDQQGCPTFSPDLSEAVSRLIAGNHSGIFHVTNSGHCSWFEFARQILKAAGIRNVEVKPISSDKLMRPACRSPYGVLNNGKYSRVTGHTLRHWKDALDAYLKAVEH